VRIGVKTDKGGKGKSGNTRRKNHLSFRLGQKKSSRTCVRKREWGRKNEVPRGGQGGPKVRKKKLRIVRKTHFK